MVRILRWTEYPRLPSALIVIIDVLQGKERVRDKTYNDGIRGQREERFKHAMLLALKIKKRAMSQGDL